MQTDPAAAVPRAQHEDAVLRFYGALADEIRAPLAALAGLTEVLAAQAGPGAAETQHEVRAILARLRRRTDEAADAAAVALGRLGLHRRPVDLGRIVAGAVSSDVELVPPPVVTVDADPDRIRQIVRALVAAASLGKGRITAVVEAHDAYAEVRVTTSALLPFEVIQGLFEAFARPSGVSDGVGLSLARALAEAHGGHVGAEPGDATTLWLRLPRPSGGSGQR